MKIGLLKYILLAVFFAILHGTHAQNEGQEQLKKKFTDYSNKALQEKLFVHTDRDFYLTGEKIWFTIYAVDGMLHQPLSMSKVAYIEILDKNNQPVSQAKIDMNDGYGDGALFLPASIGSGKYTFRAYTSWMKNFNADFFFRKTISIVNTFLKLEKQNNPGLPKIEVNFFPEGGNLISSAVNKVAFKVSSDDGKGVDFLGAIVDQRNDTILRFSPMKFGMGSFSFSPVTEGKYRAVIKTKNRQVILSEFPQAQLSGYSLRLEEAGDQIKIQVTHKSAEDNSGEPVYLFIHARQLVSKAEVRFLQTGAAFFLVPKKDIAEGISHFTVFSKSLRPVCERLYYKQPVTDLHVQVKGNQQLYGKRKKVSLGIETNSPAHLSIAIVRDDSLSATPSNHIGNYFWLTSDLRGEIESPEFYNGSDSVTRIAQDNLMMTQGWRRFTWDSILSRKFSPRFSPEFGGHIIQAKITDQQGAAMPRVVGYVSVPKKAINVYASSSNANGETFFEMKNFKGPQELIIQTNPKQDSTRRIEIIDPFSKAQESNFSGDLKLSSRYEKRLLDRSVAMQVQDIYMRGESELLNSPVDSSTFYGSANETYYLDQYTRFPVMEEVMREYVHGVFVRKRKDGFHFTVLNSLNNSVFQDTPLILVDGVPLFDEDEIMNFDPLRIKKIEVTTRRYFLGPNVFPGIVSYSTYRGDLGGFQLNPHCVKLNYEGLEQHREFYSPKYENQQQMESRVPDQRNLLYWNPSINTDKNGSYQIEFYTSDLDGDFQIVVEGIAKNGTVGNSTSSFKVKATGSL